jgi:hypothetical protein
VGGVLHKCASAISAGWAGSHGLAAPQAFGLDAADGEFDDKSDDDDDDSAEDLAGAGRTGGMQAARRRELPHASELGSPPSIPLDGYAAGLSPKRRAALSFNRSSSPTARPALLAMASPVSKTPPRRMRGGP